MIARQDCPFLRIPFILLICLLLALMSGCAKQSLRYQAQRGQTVSMGTAIAQTALKQVGRPYVYGGASPSRGFDCSGLVFWSYGTHGITVPRISRDQAKAGTKVGRNDLRPGDIVVFRIPRSGYHTGIYVGQSNFVHSPKPRSKVRVESLNINYWSRYYVSGRRIVRR